MKFIPQFVCIFFLPKLFYGKTALLRAQHVYRIRYPQYLVCLCLRHIITYRHTHQFISAIFFFPFSSMLKLKTVYFSHSLHSPHQTVFFFVFFFSCFSVLRFFSFSTLFPHFYCLWENS